MKQLQSKEMHSMQVQKYMVYPHLMAAYTPVCPLHHHYNHLLRFGLSNVAVLGDLKAFSTN